ncbi:hypothetical protein J6590_026508 [Homalodisca vitripennis]|nr:hypothetical protein J6590_026508 [Homalodisca vitripennis]
MKKRDVNLPVVKKRRFCQKPCLCQQLCQNRATQTCHTDCKVACYIYKEQSCQQSWQTICTIDHNLSWGRRQAQEFHTTPSYVTF